MSNAKKSQGGAKEELQLQKSFLDAIIENIPLGVFVKEVGNEFRISHWNKAAEEIFEIPRHQILGKNAHDLWPKDQADSYLAADEKVVKEKKLVNIPEEPSQTSTRGTIYLHTRKVPLTIGSDDKVTHLLCICDDITERKITEETLKKAQLNTLNTAKMASLGEMAGGVAHEINNPLAIIQGKAFQLRRKMQNGTVEPEQIKEELSKILSTADRIDKIIKGLTAFSRNADGDPLEPYPLRRIIDDTLELCQERLKHHNVELRFGSLPEVNVLCRPPQISQVLLNVLNNAYDAIAGRNEKWIEIKVINQASSALLVVTDSGPGIPHEVALKMLEPFFSTKEVGQGAGLGLSIAKGILEAHKGRIFYDPSWANTRFVIELPKPLADMDLEAA